MKLERVNDHQIRCTLTNKELELRNLQLNEIAYGSEKVKKLFQDMMEMAAYELDFDAEDTPLMIEVIPFKEYAVITITKVDDPDELDTRFSRFSPTAEGGEDLISGILSDVLHTLSEKRENFADLYKKMQELNSNRAASKALPDKADKTENAKEVKSNEEKKVSERWAFYTFHSIREVINACHILKTSFKGISTLYKNTSKESYVLELRGTEMTEDEFNVMCCLLAEYAKSIYNNGYFKFHAKEHYELLISEGAVENLSAV